MQWAGAHAEITGGEIVAAMGLDAPDPIGLIPLYGTDLGVEKRLVMKVVLLGDALAMGADLRAPDIFLGRDVAGFFKQRQVDHGGGVTAGAGVAVPVPGSAYAAGLVDQAKITDAGFLEPRPDNEARKTSANEGERHMVPDGFSLLERGVRID